MCSTYSASFLTQSKNWYNLEKDIHICTLAFSNDQKWPYNTLRENNSLCLIVAVSSMSGSTYTHCSVLTETECLKRHDTLNRFWQFAAILRWQKVDCSRYALICTYMEKKSLYFTSKSTWCDFTFRWLQSKIKWCSVSLLFFKFTLILYVLFTNTVKNAVWPSQCLICECLSPSLF